MRLVILKWNLGRCSQVGHRGGPHGSAHHLSIYFPFFRDDSIPTSPPLYLKDFSPALNAYSRLTNPIFQALTSFKVEMTRHEHALRSNKRRFYSRGLELIGHFYALDSKPDGNSRSHLP